jgi:hypothetical protein
MDIKMGGLDDPSEISSEHTKGEGKQDEALPKNNTSSSQAPLPWLLESLAS